MCGEILESQSATEKSNSTKKTEKKIALATPLAQKAFLAAVSVLAGDCSLPEIEANQKCWRNEEQKPEKKIKVLRFKAKGFRRKTLDFIERVMVYQPENKRNQANNNRSNLKQIG